MILNFEFLSFLESSLFFCVTDMLKNSQAGGPSFSVELGRRDGLISQASRVAENIPEPSFNLTQLTTIFAKNNLSQTDMIALSGAHTLGVSHCTRIADRLYGFPPDPYLDKNYKGQLMLKCPQTAPTDGVVTMDSTPLTFDNLYYKSLKERKGLLYQMRCSSLNQHLS